MIIDFKEIPAGNRGGDGQDKFEFFARDFLEELGFEILQQPSRGPDGKKDMIVYGSFDNKPKILWLVSCKHHAHSRNKRAVSEIDEINPIERMKSNKCDGFIGIYSTIASSGWSERLFQLRDEYRSEIFDSGKIERQIIKYPQRHDLFWRYFTKSYEKHKKHLNDMHANNNNTLSALTEDDLLRINITAIILIELEKIKERYSNTDWEDRNQVLRELYKYSDHSNLKVADSIFDFLNEISYQTSSGMSIEVASTIHSLIISYFPYTDNEADKDRIVQLADKCVDTAYNLIYDASIYMNNYWLMMYGLTILKYIYLKGKRLKYNELMDKVDNAYDEIEFTLTSRERDDLSNAVSLVEVFKRDRLKGTLTFPMLPKNLHKLIYSNR